jgi:AcrR family transcriptional regulator
MQVTDERKRSKILAAAAELFAAHPFHKVLLSDVAEAAGVGKGTLYIYFKSKDDLYLSVLSSGFTQLLDQLRRKMDQNEPDAMKNLETVIHEIVRLAYQNPHMFELMRTIPWRQITHNAQWSAKRAELEALIESIIRQGIACKTFIDPHPELTARFIPSLVRSVMMEGSQNVDRRTLTEHILHFTRSALTSRIQGA